VHIVAAGLMVPRLLDVTEAYGSAGGEASMYASVGDPARVTLALRAGGKQVWGRYPFHAAAYLGGATTLRGYAQQRFAGDAAVFGNAELRLFVMKTPRSLPGELGVFGLADLGRVYLAGEHSDRWHGAVGGGVWVAFIERGAGVNIAFARSPERTAWYGGLGFMF
jgi:hemolysin activation/secretion protein